jgi:hypothetical protein
MNDKEQKNNSKIARRSLCLASNQLYRYDKPTIKPSKSMARSKSTRLSKSHSAHHLEQLEQHEYDGNDDSTNSKLYKRTLLSRATVTPMATSSVLKRFSSIDGGGSALTKSSLKSSALKTPNYSKIIESNGGGGGNFRLGQRVKVPSLSLVGTVRFCGETKFKANGLWLGLELDESGKGKNDGSVQG